MTAEPPLQSGLARLQRLAQQQNLSGITVSAGDGAEALLVEGAEFVRVIDANTAMLHCPVDQKVLLMEISPDLYFETDHYIGQDAMLIRLDRIGDEELSLRLHDAWTFKAPERLKKG